MKQDFYLDFEKGENMIDCDDYFGGLTREEYEKETEEHFKFIDHIWKCDLEFDRQTEFNIVRMIVDCVELYEKESKRG